MIAEFVSWYVESVNAFWQSFAGGGGLRWVLICLLIWWIFCRGKRCRRHCHGRRWRCRACGCICGHCRCEDVGEDDEDGEKGEATDAKT